MRYGREKKEEDRMRREGRRREEGGRDQEEGPEGEGGGGSRREGMGRDEGSTSIPASVQTFRRSAPLKSSESFTTAS